MGVKKSNYFCIQTVIIYKKYLAASMGSAYTPAFLPGEFHGQRSPAGYRPQGHQELDTTE